ncbi:HU family DNA-binding protein [Geofilum sp. OHC36d9]|uniref:HU family DNA-binding protein n=1 Tax=Geofilum sp. OHC36d9 TaxID=3458413 RepID=UPI0040334B76
MSLFYNKIQRKNPRNPEEPAKWYLSLRSTGLVKEEEVAKRIADETTLNPKEAEMSLAQLEKVLIQALLNGQTVQLGTWGSFYLTLNSEGVESEDEVSASQVKKINLRFSAGKSIKEAIAKASFKDVDSLTK